MGHLKREEVAEIGFTLAVLDQNEDGLTRFLIFALFHKRFLPFLKALKNQNCPFLS